MAWNAYYCNNSNVLFCPYVYVAHSYMARSCTMYGGMPL